MESTFKVGDQVKFKVANGTYYGEVSKVTEGGCYITRKDGDDVWLSNDCITKLKPRKVPTPKPSSITKKDILELMNTCLHVGWRYGTDGSDFIVGDKSIELYDRWKENLK